MTHDELRQLVKEVQQRRTELDNVEVKTARGGTPRRLHEPLSAFANRMGGGVLLFGLSESDDFAVVGVGNVQKLQEDITHLAATNMESTLRPQFVVDEIDGETVMGVEVSEVPAAHKPCFYKEAGLSSGAYLRSANTNRQMTQYEVFGYLSSRGQPTHDEEPVAPATLNDLNNTLLDMYLTRLRHARPRANFLEGSQEEVLARLHVLHRHGERACPTLAGLLMFGKYPQEFFPQLMITFVQYYGTTEEEKTPQGARFMDNQRFEGPIPEMVEQAERYVLGAMRKATLIEGMFRRDIPEYPLEALREALANAVAHRDYSSYVRGSYIQIRMFADRLEIQSPGSLFGNVNEENLEEEHSTRNARLTRMMEDMHIVENRGSGVKAMLQAMRESNLEPPQFTDRRTSFRVIFLNHTLMSPEAITWLNQFAARALNDRQRLALVYLRQHGEIHNGMYRRLNRVDAMTAGQELHRLVQEGLVVQQSVGRWTSYKLQVPLELPAQPVPQNEEDKILAYVQQVGSITNTACRALLNVDATRAYYVLQKLCEVKRLQSEGKGKGRRYVLP